MEIIGLLGNAGVGKNYIAEHILPKILPNKKTVILAFADHFKVDCIIKHNIEYERVFGEKDFESRKLLQKVGTEEGRTIYGEDIWIKSVETWIKILNSRGIKRFIICDCRFKNEVLWIKKKGGIIIKVNAPQRHIYRLNQESNDKKEQSKEISKHISEKEVNQCSFDFEVNNDYDDNPLKELSYQLKIYKLYKLSK